MSTDISSQLTTTVQSAADSGSAVNIVGGGTKQFYGRSTNGRTLNVGAHQGIVSYEPTELVITARAGTRLSEVEAVLAEKNQMLAFEPPYFGDDATLGGSIACGFSGPRRPYAGAARDFVLGTKILNGKGEILSFGGQVMKNVAGYDISRLMTGSLGTLAVLLEISLKVLPKPESEVTVTFNMGAEEALTSMNNWAGRPIPISGAAHDGDTLYIRFSGSAGAVDAARKELGGDGLACGSDFWHDLREHRLQFFAGDTPLWRLSVAPVTPILPIPGVWLYDWGGTQRWLRTDAPPDTIFQTVDETGGHATLFRGGDHSGEVFHPLAPELAEIHRNLKQAFDPCRVFNSARIYPDL